MRILLNRGGVYSVWAKPLVAGMLRPLPINFNLLLALNLILLLMMTNY
jgi:hypothetical protein